MARDNVMAFPGHRGYRGNMASALEVRIRPSGRRLELSRLTSTLDQLRRALSDIDRAYSFQSSRLRWLIDDLQYQAHQVTIRVAPAESPRRPIDSESAPARALVAGIKSLETTPAVPDYYSDKTIERILEISNPKRGVSELSLATTNGATDRAVPVTEPVRQNARKAVMGSQVSLGSFSGWLDAMNARRLAQGSLRVALFDPATRRAVTGEIPADMADVAHETFWRRRVLAIGKISRNGQGQPVRIKIERLELLPDDDSGRASPDELLGAAPDWLGGQAVDDYIREARRA